MLFSRRLLIIFTTLASICFVLSLLLVFNYSTIGGYEISIYNSYPIQFWIILFISIFLCEIIIISLVYSNKIKYSYLLFCLFILICSYYLVIMFPIIKEYIIYGREDVLTNIGYMKDILLSGHIPSDNIYPLIHIFGVIFSLFSSIGLYDITKIFLPFYSLFYILITFILFKLIFKNIKISIFSLLFITIPIYQASHNLFAPYQQVFFLLPMAIYLYLKNIQINFTKNWLFTLILFCTYMIFSHPLIALLMISIFIIIHIGYYIHIKISLNYNNSNNSIKYSSYIIIILTIIYILWRYFFTILLNKIENVYLSFFANEETSELHYYVGLINYANITFQNILILSFNLYGQWIIMGIISIIAIFYLVLIKKSYINYITSIMFLGYLFFTCISFIIFISYHVVGFGRFYEIATIFSIFIITYFYYPLIKTTLKSLKIYKIISIFILLSILLSINYFSIFNIHYSPIIKSYNEQVTNSDLTGMKFFFEDRDKQVEILEIGISTYRFHNALYGNEIIDQNIVNNNSTVPIPHFGYTNYTSFSDSYENQKYLILSKLGKILNPSVNPDYENLWKFNNSDFNRIKNDLSLNLIYTNGNIEIYKNLYVNKKIS